MFKKGVLGALVLSVTLALAPIHGAEAAETENELTKISTETLTYEGETFELEKWKDENDVEIYTIATDVENKEAIAEFVNQLINEPVISPMGFKNNWSKSFYDVDSWGKFDWNPSGFNEQAYLAPITADRIYINAGNLNAYYTGSGLPDKLVVFYSYEFSGFSLLIGAAPAASKSSNTVSWKSEPVTGTWYINTKSHWAEAKAHGPTLVGVTLSGGADVYKGSNIYRPYDSQYVRFLDVNP
ncbi:hypothetical protein [Bacillus sp. FJAT-29937]|uniref:hypothetical protein n=1 Tax=Bacillus sp. FJAT-29937 TaxID=1720553 RepID=UPI000833098E|nr:hypothetical protein [Bacillus sp. FJAT-29937]